MSQTEPKQPKNNVEKNVDKSTQLNRLMQRAANTLDASDETAAAQRIAALRQEYPAATPDELVDIVLRQKCLQAGAIGAATSSAGIIPGLGTAVALTLGFAADLGMTLKLQVQLVLEIIQIYGHEISLAEKRNLIMLITGLSLGVEEVAGRVGTRLAERAAVRLEAEFAAKAVPVLGIAASAGIDVFSTYLIGRRAQAYFQRSPEALNDWNENARILTGLDERKVGAWVKDASQNAWQATRSQTQNMASNLLGAGKASGKLVAIGAGKTGKTLTNLTQWVGQKSLPTAQQTRAFVSKLRRQQKSDEV